VSSYLILFVSDNTLKFLVRNSLEILLYSYFIFLFYIKNLISYQKENKKQLTHVEKLLKNS